uniref:Uncharacterized protein n=1 Tax=uncultured Thiotrichaceae bacterium TaxID=298394 RepID=A0A6S6U258_9GAMM|nr:MAG: Unknown protein [uncultured Thiotrichaceae bacterium]
MLVIADTSALVAVATCDGLDWLEICNLKYIWVMD